MIQLHRLEDLLDERFRVILEQQKEPEVLIVLAKPRATLEQHYEARKIHENITIAGYRYELSLNSSIHLPFDIDQRDYLARANDYHWQTFNCIRLVNRLIERGYSVNAKDGDPCGYIKLSNPETNVALHTTAGLHVFKPRSNDVPVGPGWKFGAPSIDMALQTSNLKELEWEVCFMPKTINGIRIKAYRCEAD